MRKSLLICLLLTACAVPPPVELPAKPEPVKSDTAARKAEFRGENHPNGRTSWRAEIKRSQYGEVYDGPYESWWPNGIRASDGIYVNGEKNGLWRQWQYDGDPECEATFDHDILDGAWKRWHESGSFAEEGAYRKGELDGEWREYNEKGLLLVTTVYERGRVTKRTFTDVKVQLRTYDSELELYLSYWAVRDPDGTPFRNGEVIGEDDRRRVRLRGSYVNNQRDGCWTRFNENSEKVLECSYSKGLLVGAWLEWHAGNRRKAVGRYLDGARTGCWQEWHDNGVDYLDCNYGNGKLEGRYRENTRNGRCAAIGEYTDGVRTGTWREAEALSFDERFPEHLEGTAIGSYFDGKRNGIWKCYYDSKNLAWAAEFKAGIPRGTVIEWYDSQDEEMRCQGDLQNGKKEGRWVWWYPGREVTAENEVIPHGKIALDAAFADGKLHGQCSSFYSDGKRWREATFDTGYPMNAVREWDPHSETSLVRSGSMTPGFVLDHQGKVLREVYSWPGDDPSRRITDDTVRTFQRRDPEGVLVEEYEYLLAGNGSKVRHGKFNRWWSNGQLRVKGRFELGVASDLWTYYRVIGGCECTGMYQHGLKWGTWQYFHFNGRISAEGQWAWLVNRDTADYPPKVLCADDMREQVGWLELGWQKRRYNPSARQGVWKFWDIGGAVLPAKTYSK